MSEYPNIRVFGDKRLCVACRAHSWHFCRAVLNSLIEVNKVMINLMCEAGADRDVAATDFTAADENNDLHHIQNILCPTCSGPNARTIVLPVENIPHFRHVALPSVECPNCHYRSHLDSGVLNTSLAARDWEDGDVMNRRVVKSDSAKVFVPTLDLELPSATQSGVDTIGCMQSEDAGQLESLQGQLSRMGDVDKFHRCHGVMSMLANILDGESRCDDATTCGSYEKVEEHELTIVIDDPARSSCIENPKVLYPDPNMRCEEYERTPTHDEVLGLQPSIGAIHMGPIENHNSIENDHSPSRRHSLEIDEDRISNSISPISQVHEEVMTFPTTCPHCQTQAETKMWMTDIPHFKEVVIMCLQCEHCGFRSNEINGGGATPRLGTKITLRAIDMRDLAREVLKSDTAGVSVPELDLELDEGGLGGMYTTVEGLLLKMHDRLRDAHPIKTGELSTKQQSSYAREVCSAPRHEYERYNEFLTQLKDTAMGQRFPFTLILVDSVSNSFVGPKSCDMHFNRMCDDEGLEIEEFERTEDQNEGLGLNDIRTETT